MSKEERVQAYKLAHAVNAIEGVPVSHYAQVLFRCWVNGELSDEQMKTALLAYHQRLAAREV